MNKHVVGCICAACIIGGEIEAPLVNKDLPQHTPHIEYSTNTVLYEIQAANMSAYVSLASLSSVGKGGFTKWVDLK